MAGATMGHCFLKGTRILTSDGERPIEDLRIGDVVLTVSGKAKPIRWIGRMRFERGGRASWDDAVAPIKIARGAFNGDQPQSDLYVSVVAPLCDRRQPLEIIQDELASQAHYRSAA